MYDDGYRNIVNVDYSAVCIERMKALHTEARPEMLCTFRSEYLGSAADALPRARSGHTLSALPERLFRCGSGQGDNGRFDDFKRRCLGK